MSNITLPKKDYSNYIFNTVNLNKSKFTRGSIFNIEKKIPNSLFKCSIPPSLTFDNPEDIFYYNIPMENIIFNENVIFPNDSNFFQTIKHRKIINCTMPIMDYSNYNFNNIYLYNTIFPDGCILPSKKSFFKNFADYNNVSLPRHTIDNLHNYDLPKKMFFEIIETNEVPIEVIYLYKHKKSKGA